MGAICSSQFQETFTVIWQKRLSYFVTCFMHHKLQYVEKLNQVLFQVSWILKEKKTFEFQPQDLLICSHVKYTRLGNWCDGFCLFQFFSILLKIQGFLCKIQVKQWYSILILWWNVLFKDTFHVWVSLFKRQYYLCFIAPCGLYTYIYVYFVIKLYCIGFKVWMRQCQSNDVHLQYVELEVGLTKPSNLQGHCSCNEDLYFDGS